MNTPAPEKPSSPKTPPNITIELKVTYPAKKDLTLAELAAEGEKAKKMMDQVKSGGGTVSGSLTIGKQTFPL